MLSRILHKALSEIGKDFLEDARLELFAEVTRMQVAFEQEEVEQAQRARFASKRTLDGLERSGTEE